MGQKQSKTESQQAAGSSTFTTETAGVFQPEAPSSTSMNRNAAAKISQPVNPTPQGINTGPAKAFAGPGTLENELSRLITPAVSEEQLKALPQDAVNHLLGLTSPKRMKVSCRFVALRVPVHEEAPTAAVETRKDQLRPEAAIAWCVPLPP